ncbi:SpoIID/LytB domain-containing protein [Denitratimonas tolerans]|uniref:SpoIID/LytB domain-containing protein n=1 Tax=Denitratimonas tolerans TaxID=1338420 RepID=A0AAW9R194_9GAMM|nr:hypothetical protein [Xanthomonadaceae bacterium]HRO86592.1 SpoIID/LytB domain-containing protein [Chiayiivirga sp.]HRQ35272.1 SpoIID/LytB domain-containing protein [Chiayiivirga sp.]
MGRMIFRGGLVTALWLLAAGSGSALELAARDARTGAPLDASVEFADPGGVRRFDVHGRLAEVASPSRQVQATARAAGYRDLGFTLDPATAGMTLLLDPLVEPEAVARLSAQAARDPAARWLHGWVRRSDDGAAVAGARIDFEGRVAYSDAEGHFELALVACGPGDLTRSRLRVQATGFAEQVRDGLVCTPGVQTRLLALGGEAPGLSREVIGAMDRRDSAVTGDAAGEVLTGALPARARMPIGPLVAPTLLPPASIRVGYSNAACTDICCTGSCTHTCTYSLETYVARGLGDEWISGWNQASLRAGSIAYRSYGAWRVANPIRPTFDICSSACCQVNDPDTYTSTTNAVARTPGIMLMRAASGPISSEYSAENNSWDDPDDGLNCSNSDLSCGNGFVGSPATGWSCLADAVAAGRGCFGHGRGMSQWGTKRWGDAPNGKSWPWIVDHYYNASGAGSGLRTAVMTSPVSLASIQAHLAALLPGATFQIQAQATNAAGAAHAHLLMGASLYRSGVGYIDDGANDAPISLAPGTHAVTRDFQVPPGTPAGSYALWVSLYLDVDENGSISATDLPLALETVPGAVTIQVPGGAIFADGFEGGP